MEVRLRLEYSVHRLCTEYLIVINLGKLKGELENPQSLVSDFPVLVNSHINSTLFLTLN